MTTEPGSKPPGKRNAGSNKSRRKKREYKAHIRAKLAGGQVNDARGSWVSSAQLDQKVRDRAEKIAARMSR